MTEGAPVPPIDAPVLPTAGKAPAAGQATGRNAKHCRRIWVAL